MKKLAGAILLAAACAGLIFAQDKMAPGKSPSVTETITKLEHDWIAAEKAADADALSRIIADDWVALGPDGSTATKKDYIAGYKSGKTKMESFELGPVAVKVLGDVAVAQGSDIEKSTAEGQDTSGKWIWMDVFVKRGGKWVAVRSQNSRAQ